MNHTAYVFFSSFLLMITILGSTHVCCMYFFLLLNNVVWLYITLAIHVLVDIRLMSSLGVLEINLLWTFVYKSLCGYLSLSLSGLYLGVELLMVILCLTFCRTARLFYKAAAPFSIPTSHVRGFKFSLCPHQHLLLSIFLIKTILVVGVK